MIEYLKGRLVEKTPTYAVIECSGVGYFINISLHTYSLISNNEECKLLTHLSIKEDSHTLYGFIDDTERVLFRNLISVSGVGTGTARMMLSSLAPEEIRTAILNNNIATLQSIKGIGGKTAQRIVIDLKDKLLKTSESSSQLFFSQNNSIKEEALSALITLGFAKNVAEKALDQILKNKTETAPTVEKLIKTALQSI
jgi:holliday junction DNA helicase RuvA